MARHTVLPSTADLRRMISEGMSHAQIAEKITKETGVPVARSTVSSAIHRAGESEHQPRYENTVPWTVKSVHSAHYAARMLRALGRQSSGKDLPPAEERRLESFLRRLAEEKWCVAYCPDDPGQGFHYIDERYADHPQLPIRMKPLRLDNLPG